MLQPSFLVLCFLGAFYGLLTVGLVRRAMRPTCRNCSLWQHCLEQQMGIPMDTAGVLGKIVYWFLFLIFLVPALDALGLTTVSAILSGLVAYIPNVFVAILVLFLGALLATFVADIVRGATATANIGNPTIFAGIARWAIIGFAALVALEQLQIAPALINLPTIF